MDDRKDPITGRLLKDKGPSTVGQIIPVDLRIRLDTQTMKDTEGQDEMSATQVQVQDGYATFRMTKKEADAYLSSHPRAKITGKLEAASSEERQAVMDERRARQEALAMRDAEIRKELGDDTNLTPAILSSLSVKGEAPRSQNEAPRGPQTSQEGTQSTATATPTPTPPTPSQEPPAPITEEEAAAKDRTEDRTTKERKGGEDKAR